MKKRSFFFCLTFLSAVITACSQQESTFEISNPSSFDRTDELLVLTRDAITARQINIPDNQLPVAVAADGNYLPSQADDIDNDGKWDELAFLIDIPDNSSEKVNIRFLSKEEYPVFTPRTNVRFGVLENGKVADTETLSIAANELPVPLFTRFQMDGPAWENDKIGFRQYIDGRNARDLYGKKMNSMALDTVGIAPDGSLEDDYHVMLPWGRDVLAVGNSLGLGGLAMLENTIPVRLGVTLNDSSNNIRTTDYTLITEGPVRSIFKLSYRGWDTGSGTYDLENLVTIQAGKYGYENKVKLSGPHEKDTLLAGMVNIHNDLAPVRIDSLGYVTFYTHDRQTYDNEWYLGMGLIFPESNYIGYEVAPESGDGITNSYLNLLEASGGEWITYYVFAGWELSDEQFTNRKFFENLLKLEMEKLSEAININ